MGRSQLVGQRQPRGGRARISLQGLAIVAQDVFALSPTRVDLRLPEIGFGRVGRIVHPPFERVLGASQVVAFQVELGKGFIEERVGFTPLFEDLAQERLGLGAKARPVRSRWLEARGVDASRNPAPRLLSVRRRPRRAVAWRWPGAPSSIAHLPTWAPSSARGSGRSLQPHSARARRSLGPLLRQTSSSGNEPSSGRRPPAQQQPGQWLAHDLVQTSRKPESRCGSNRRCTTGKFLESLPRARSEARGISEDHGSVACVGGCRSPAAFQTGLQQLARGGPMIPDGDRRHDTESRRIVDQEQAFPIWHHNIMAEFVLRDHVFNLEWWPMADYPVEQRAGSNIGLTLHVE